ncbi:MAG: SDR family oxidoreductase [Deltaproteobacteria bacterium]|nr:SDR family oxidoreductase [Deltaproteobacteria bacterium]
MIKSALITGGNRGIGEAIVRKLHNDYEITFTYNSGSEEANNLVDELSGQNKISAICMNLLDIDDIKSKISEIFTDDTGFDILIHNAGAMSDTAFYFMSENQWDDIIQISLNSFFYLNQACLPHMISNRWGRIITISSVSGEMGNRGQVNYSAAKGAVIAATKALSKEVARKGILVNSVSPGFIDTQMTKDLEHINIKEMVPVGRAGKPSEVAGVVGFLASDDASYINGTVIQVNGGLYS